MSTSFVEHRMTSMKLPRFVQQNPEVSKIEIPKTRCILVKVIQDNGTQMQKSILKHPKNFHELTAKYT